ncbi:hypothetical protein [Planctomycetes bacterium K23_9]|uniref:Uncharacterized protein n=1 Tax=Stieleria marina TaxID=1930275 RepID=A0A517NM29_9BACT|nr:hypothetical protein K239x_00710 [Planctomycetes bacterium K23_9]
MWHTSKGDRTLVGAEAEVAAHAVDTMVDALTNFIDDDGTNDDWDNISVFCESGVALYDELPPTRRIALLREVASHLLSDTSSLMPLSAYAEAAVAAIYVEVRDQVAIEIDLFPAGFEAEDRSDDPEENVTWRELVLSAYAAVHSQDADGGATFAKNVSEPLLDLPDPFCLAIERWEPVIDSLADAVLWDRDFEMAGDFLDAEPRVSQQRRRLLGIDDDYFASIAPDPIGTEVFRLISETRSIVRSKPR